MPLHFMNFYGSTSMEEVFSTLEYAIYAHDISLICIDNMQFMLSDQAQGFQKFDLQDKVSSMLRKLATECNVHVCLVVHPKKVDDDTQLSAGSIFGSAKISQEADNVFILQKSADVPNYRMLQVVKNRFDGDVGQAGLAFNKSTKRYFELNKIERDLFEKEGGDVTKLIERRIEKYGCVEPFAEENRKERRDGDMDDKRRLMMKDQSEMARQLNLSKMIK